MVNLLHPLCAFREGTQTLPYSVRANNGFIALRLSAKHSFSLLLFLLAEKFACHPERNEVESKDPINVAVI